MIVKAGRGVDAQAALAYDHGPGHSNEHHNPRRVAGTVPGRDWRDRARSMQETLRDTGDTRADGPRRVWRLVISAAPEDRVMSDRRWGDIANRVVGEFTRSDPGRFQWEAVRHDPRHVHVTLLHRGDDGRVFREGLYKQRCQDIGKGLERDYRLREVDRTAKRGHEARRGRRDRQDRVWQQQQEQTRRLHRRRRTMERS